MNVTTGRLRVLLIYAPFGLVESPNLGASIVKAATVEAGFPCDVLYGSVEFAHLIGFKDYLALAHSDSQTLLPERLFASAVFDRIPPMEAYYDAIVAPFNEAFGTWLAPKGPQSPQVDQLRAIEECAVTYCDEVAARPEMASYDIFAFSSSTGQNLASLAIAKRLKARFPEKLVVFGGANADGEMGPQLVRSFPFIDYAFAGDGDVGFPLFLDAVQQKRPVDLPGVFSRQNAATQVGTVAPLLRVNMDELPYPDFEDWFAAYARAPGNDGYQMSIPVEGSRGCWWGQKHHCTFCGLNGTTMAYRAKSPQRFCEEVEYLVNRYGVKSVMATDNILDSRWPKQLAALLQKKHSYDVLFFEIKANLSKADLQLLAACGITHMNPGIESFSSHVLQLMDKGSNALQNVQILKWAEEIGITLQYCFISGFPGETPYDYQEMAALLPKIVHLKPGKTFTRISIDRFSPYFTNPEKYGMQIDTCPAYRYIYDLPDDEIANLAYWCYSVSATGSSRNSLEPPSYAKRVAQLHRIWLSLYGRVDFSYTQNADGLVVLHDTRPIAVETTTTLDRLEGALFLLADRVTTSEAMYRALSSDPAWHAVSAGAVTDALGRLEARGALHRDGIHWLALANRDTGVAKGPVMAEVRLAPRTDPLQKRSEEIATAFS